MVTAAASLESLPDTGAQRLARIREAARWAWTGPRRAVPDVWYACNQTPRPIWVERDGAVFTLAPLERRSFRTDPRRRFPLDRLIERHQLAVTRRPDAAPDSSLTIAIRAWLIVGFLWLVSFWPLSAWWWQRTGAVLGIVTVLSFLVLLTRPAQRGGDPDEAGSGEDTVGWSAAGIEVGRRTWNGAVMLAVLAISVLMPAAALYYATDLHDVVSIRPTSFSIDTSTPSVLIGRLTQLTFIAVATLLPALLYFQFDAERLNTLRDRWMQNVFRLDPTVHTIADVNAKYGRQLDEAYGRPDAGRGRLTRGRRSPIILATLVLAFGWLLILLRAGDTIDTTAAGTQGLSFVHLLDPNPALVTYGFLGAYFFGVQLVWNGYVRADLRPKTYTTITVRVLVVVVLAWLMDATLGGSGSAYLYLLAFLAGIVPDTVLHFMVEKVLGRPGLFNRDRLRQLTELEGIDLYERTRLSEEGITSVEALAHHDLLDLFFKTRIAPARLIDWVDQAILVMHLGGANDTPDQPDPKDATEQGGPAAGSLPTGPPLRAALAAAGIRTATDVVFAARPEGGPGRSRVGAEGRGASTLESVVQVTSSASGTPAAAVRQRLSALSATLDHSEWIGRIENWRSSDLIKAEESKRFYIDANGDLIPSDPRVSGHARGSRDEAA